MYSSSGARHGRLGYGAFGIFAVVSGETRTQEATTDVPALRLRAHWPCDRKSIEPMAERFAPSQYDRLHHFISDGLWDAAPLETELALQADRIVGALDAFLVIDDTGLPKKGDHSVGRRVAIRFDARQESKLPDAGVGDTCTRRGSCSGWLASVSARELDCPSSNNLRLFRLWKIGNPTVKAVLR